MSMSTATMTAPVTATEPKVNRVIRRYAIVPATCNGHRLAEPCEVSLRYTEPEANALYRESPEAIAEVLRFAHKRGMLPKGIEATVTCTIESLRPAKRPDAAELLAEMQAESDLTDP